MDAVTLYMLLTLHDGRHTEVARSYASERECHAAAATMRGIAERERAKVERYACMSTFHTDLLYPLKDR